MPFSSLWNRLLGKDDTSTLEHRRDDVHDVLARDINELVDGFLKAQRFLGDDLEGGGIAPGMAYQQPTPDLTLLVTGGFFVVGGTLVDKTSGGPFTTPATVAPSTDPYIALLTIDDAGAFDWTYGTEDPSPVAPADPAGKLVLWEVYLRPSAVAINELDTQSAGTGYLYRDRRYPVGGGSGSSGGLGDLGIAFDPSQVFLEEFDTTTGTSPTGTSALPTDHPILILDVQLTAWLTSTPTGTVSLEVDATGGASWDTPLPGVTDRAFDPATGQAEITPRTIEEARLWLLGPGDQLRANFALSVSGQAHVVIRYALLNNYTWAGGEAGDGENVLYLPFTGEPGLAADSNAPASLFLGLATNLPAVQDDDLTIEVTTPATGPYTLRHLAISQQQYVAKGLPAGVPIQIPAGSYISATWATYGSGGFSRVLALRPRTPTKVIATADSPYTVSSADRVLLIDRSAGNVTINLLPLTFAPPEPLLIKVRVDGAHTLTIVADTGQPDDLDGAATFVFPTGKAAFAFVPEQGGTTWMVT